MKYVIYVLLILSFVLSRPVFAHPGNTDAYGCHTCRTNCPSWGLSYGEYHCHRAKVLPQPKEPIKSTFGEGGSGYTTPAPEYKAPKEATSQIATPEKAKVSFWQRFWGWFAGK